MTAGVHTAEVLRARELILRYGWNATAYQLVTPGMRHWFSSSADAVIGYVERSGVRVVAGAPICPEDRLGQVIDEWERQTAQAGKRVCYFGAAGRVQTALSGRQGHATVVLGAQPVWRPMDWAATVDGVASLRAQLARARNKSVTVTEWTAAYATKHHELERCLRQWLETRGLPPLHFLVEPETLGMLGDRRVFVAIRKGVVVGFVVLSPVPMRKGWLTEQFVRGRLAPNGTIELLLDYAVRTIAAEGAEYVTMGLVPLAEQAPPPPAGQPLWLTIVLRWIRAHGRRFYNFAGLEAFKSKFRPSFWEPIYAISNESRFSPGTLYAIAAAFSGRSPVVAVGIGILKAIRRELQWLGNRARLCSVGPAV